MNLKHSNDAIFQEKPRTRDAINAITGEYLSKGLPATHTGADNQNILSSVVIGHGSE